MTASRAYHEELARLRDEYLPGIRSLLQGPLLAADDGPLRRAKDRLQDAQQVLLQPADETPLLSHAELADFAKDLASNTLLRAFKQPPRPLAPPPPPPPPPQQVTAPPAHGTILRADPHLLQVGAALLAKLDKPKGGRLARINPADDPDTAMVLRRVQCLMLTHGDARNPSLEAARVVLEVVWEWQRAACASAIARHVSANLRHVSQRDAGKFLPAASCLDDVCHGSSTTTMTTCGSSSHSGNGKDEQDGPHFMNPRLQIAILKFAYPHEYAAFEEGATLRKKYKELEGGEPLLDDDDEDREGDEIDRGEADEAGGVDFADDAAVEEGSASSLSAARRELLDHITQAMSEEEYRAFCQMRVGLGISAFCKLTEHNLRRVMRMQWAEASASGYKSMKFLSRLTAIRVGELVEAAHRIEYDGQARSRTIPELPLKVSSYQEAVTTFRRDVVAPLVEDFRRRRNAEDNRKRTQLASQTGPPSKMPHLAGGTVS